MSDTDKTAPIGAIPAPLGSVSDETDRVERLEFARRLKIAFDEANNADIARKLNTTSSTIKSYTDGDRLPVSEMLLRINAATGVNLHWLLTGRGPKRVEPVTAMFSEDEEKAIRDLARASGRTFDDQVKILAIAAVEFRQKV